MPVIEKSNVVTIGTLGSAFWKPDDVLQVNNPKSQFDRLPCTLERVEAKHGKAVIVIRELGMEPQVAVEQVKNLVFVRRAQ